MPKSHGEALRTFGATWLANVCSRRDLERAKKGTSRSFGLVRCDAKSAAKRAVFYAELFSTNIFLPPLSVWDLWDY